MKITNTTKGDIGLSEVHVVPALGSIDVPNEVLSKAKVSPVVKAYFIEGKLTEDGAVEGEELRDADLPDDVTVTVDDPDRAAIIAGIIRGLDKDADFTKGGKPELAAINAAMVKGAEPVTAAERDAVWESMSA